MPGIICGAIVVDDKGRIAMVKEAKPSAYGKWNWPGGKLEPRESILAGARREVKEETSLDVKLLGLIGVYRDLRDNAVRFVFLARPIRGELKHQHGELLGARWFTEKELMKLKDRELRRTEMKRVFRDWKDGQLYPLSVCKKFG